MRTLELAANHEPVRYHDLVMTGHPKAVPPNPPRKRGYPPAWSDLCRTALGDKSLTPVKWIPQTLIITLYTLPTLLIFAWMGQVHWGLGLVIAIGGMIGARLAARLTVSRRGELWVKVMMAIIILPMAARLWV